MSRWVALRPTSICWKDRTISALFVLMLLYVALVTLAAAQDVATLRISNVLSVSVLVVAIAALIIAWPGNWWEHLAGFGIVLAVGILLFSQGWMGGGDVKLFAAAALAFNFDGLLRFLPAALISGGLIAAVMLFSRMFLPAREGPRKWRQVPYGVAIAIGAIAICFFYPAGSAFAQ